MLNSIELLMIETKPADIRLTQEYLKEYKIANCLNVVKDGEEALRFLYRQNEYTLVSLPDLILINLSMILKKGAHLPKQIKNDPTLSHIPIVVLTAFEGEEDSLSDRSFIDLCLPKPVNPDSLFSLMKRGDDF